MGGGQGWFGNMRNYCDSERGNGNGNGKGKGGGLTYYWVWFGIKKRKWE